MKLHMQIGLIVLLTILSTTATLTAREIEAHKPGGIGLSLLQMYDPEREDHLGPIVVLDVLEKGSAIKAGIQKGDIITHIDGKSTAGHAFLHVLENMLRGPAYTSVTLTIRRTSTGQTFNLTLDRVESEGLY